MIELYPYQQEAYDKLIEGIVRGEKRFACVMPTGAGKSYVMWKWAEDHPDKRILLVGPNNIIFEDQMRSFIKSYPSFHINNVFQTTYSWLSSHEIGRPEIRRPDIIFLDEFHHLGAPVWGEGIQGLANAFPDAPIIGLSATPLRASDGGRNVAEEFFNSNYICNLNIFDGWAREDVPLKVPTFIRAIYSSYKDLADIKRRIANIRDEVKKKTAKQKYEEARRSLDKSMGMPKLLKRELPLLDGHYLVFCRNIKHLREMKQSFIKWLDEAKIEHVEYEIHIDIDGNPSDELRLFEYDETPRAKFLFSVNMLSEGIHCKNDGVFLCRPTGSQTVFFQQIGRASSVGTADTKVVFDLVNNCKTAGISEMESKGRGRFSTVATVGNKKGDTLAYQMLFKVTPETLALDELYRSIAKLSAQPLDECITEWIEHYGRKS